VGAGIIAHGFPFSSHWLHLLHDAFHDNTTAALIVEIVTLMVAGLVMGFVIALVATPVLKLIENRKARKQKEG
jgi:hypothetical protein